MDARGVQEMLLRLPIPHPFNRDGNQMIGYFYGVAAVCARHKLMMDEISPELVRAILVADPVKWPSWMLTETGLDRSVWDYNGGGDPRSGSWVNQWWMLAGALKNRVRAEWQLR